MLFMLIAIPGPRTLDHISTHAAVSILSGKAGAQMVSMVDLGS